MKKMSLVAGVVLALCAGTVNAGAHGCWGGGFWPFWTFGLGWGLGAAFSYPAYRTTYVYPAYSYYYPPAVSTYSYSPPASQPQEAPAPDQPAPSEPEPQVWVPSSPGPGTWVPERQPYRYVPTAAHAATPPAQTATPQTVTLTNSAGGVPVRIIR